MTASRLTLFLVIAGSCYAAWKLTARSQYETAKYQTLMAEGAFELRQYPDLMLASTATNGASQGSDGSFTRLFEFITGENERSEKIAMTTPVFMAEASSSRQATMGFVMPREVTKQGIPKPSADDVDLRQRPGGRFAAVRFSGRLNREQIQRFENQLRAWVRENDWTVAGGLELAGYDPPWTPGPLRRNELLLRVN